MQHIDRFIAKDIEQHLFGEKIVILYGPRRVGKTTLVKEFLKKYESAKKTLYLNGDDLIVQKNLSSQNHIQLKQFLGNADFVVIDEAQRVPNIGINLKILVDFYPEIQIIATGSSSFDLANRIKEPLTGRVWEYFLPPLSFFEIREFFPQHELVSLIPGFLNYGFYPDVFNAQGGDRERVLQSTMQNYLFKDILDYEGQKNSEFVFKLLQLLAFQVGHEVSYNELARTLEVSKTLVEKYIYLLEQTFVIFRLNPFSRNLRNEVGKKRKIYFWDVGMRNALIQNFHDVNIRADIGQLWENFCIVERVKFLKSHTLYRNLYYRRTYQQKEIDYLEEYDGALHGYEIKWSDRRSPSFQEFLKAYPGSSVQMVSQSGFFDFAEGKS